MSNAFAAAVVAAFGEERRETLYGRFSGFRSEHWNASYGWLDASGLELYLLARLRALEMEAVIPLQMLHRMDRNLADNRRRMTEMFQEFIRINDAMQQAQLNYCNVKGFSLMPISCPDPGLRRQLSLDFVVERHDASGCAKVLARLGYVPCTLTEQFQEYRHADAETASTNLYQSIAHRRIRLYLVAESADDLERAPYETLTQRESQSWNGYTFPALALHDQFIAQAMRMLGHIGVEWNRLAFLLEFWTCMKHWEQSTEFWYEVRQRARTHPLRPIAVGTASVAAVRIFGGELSVPPGHWGTDDVQDGVRAWAAKFGWRSLVADFPGTQLLALLEQTPRIARSTRPRRL